VKIPVERQHRDRFYQLCEQVFESNYLSEGPMVDRFERAFAGAVGPAFAAAAVCNWGAGMLAVLEHLKVAGGEVIVPSNTFMACVRAVERSGATPVLADCRRDDLCLSAEAVEALIGPKTRAVMLVHIGGHLAFDADRIADICGAHGVPLVEDCAHCHGAEWDGRRGGCWGAAGVYSFYATKTMPTGEGGMVVSRDADLMAYVRKWRNYGKFDYKIAGYNGRMNELTAAFGLVQLERLDEILAFKRSLAAKYDQIFDNRVRFPDGMQSGYYKYVVFDTPLSDQTGKVFGDPCHLHMDGRWDLPNTDWVSSHHACAPIYYGYEHAEETVEPLRERLLA